MAAAAALVVGILAGQWPLAVIGAVVAVGALAFLSMRQTQGSDAYASLDLVSNDNRIRISPIKKLHREISGIVAANSKNPAIHVIGPEAIAEADQILKQTVRMLQLRDGLANALKSRGESERESAELEERLIGAGAEEAASLKSALDAKAIEVGHFSKAQVGVDRIDAGLRQAEAALSELKVRLSVAATESQELESQDQSLNDTIGRLHVLGTSLEEAEATLKEGMR